jgi:Trm5-related predicted tRNA methylase
MTRVHAYVYLHENGVAVVLHYPDNPERIVDAVLWFDARKMKRDELEQQLTADYGVTEVIWKS